MIRRRVRYEAYTDTDPHVGCGWLWLLYNPREPLAVGIEFEGYPKEQSWAFGRNLLLQGVQYPVGLGDVHIAPYASRIAVTLSSPDGRALFLLNRAPVDEFAQQVRDIQDDTPDIDGLLAEIFREQR